MSSISNVSFNVLFDLTGSPKIRLTDTTTSPPAGMVGVFTITQPDGYVRTGNVNSPDIVGGGYFEYALTPDSIGGPQCGSYTIKLTVAAPGYFSTEFTRTFVFDYKPVGLVLTKNFDIFTPNLSYSDGTAYAIGGYTASAVTRSWISTSSPTGTLTSSGVTINLAYNGQYYDALYTTTLTSSLTYQSTAYAWLSVSETLTKTDIAGACTPKPLDELVQMLESFRNGDIDCSGETPDFDRAQILYTHLIDMLRLLLAGGIGQPGVLKVYEDFLFLVRGNQSIACTHTNQPIPAYDFSDYEVTPFTADASYCTTFGDGVNLSYTINHKLNDTCVLAQVYEVATGQQVFADLVVVDSDNIYVTLLSIPTVNQYRVVVHVGLKGLQGPPGPGFPLGGLTGQFLVKKTNADWDTEWKTFDIDGKVPYTGAVQDVNLGEFGVQLGNIEFDNTPTNAPTAPGSLYWNDQDGTLDLKLKGGNVTLHVGQQEVVRVVNKTNANLLESQYRAVRIRKVSEGGAQGGRLAVVLAQSNNEANSTDVLGLVAENISNNQEGFITVSGHVRSINTTGSLQGETWADGDVLYLSPTTPGVLTNIKPSAPNHLVIMGYVEYAHQNNGKIFVKVDTGYALDELHNVAATNPSDKDGIFWNNSTKVWENKSISTVLGYTPQAQVVHTQVYFMPGDVGFPAVGASTYTNASLSGANVLMVFRNGLPQFNKDPGDGDSFFTFAGTTITFSSALGAGEKIIITAFKF